MFAAPINGRSSESHQARLNGRVVTDEGKANGGMRPQMQGGQPPMGMPPMRGGRKQVGEYITDLDMQKYLNYVVSTQALKGVPAFDSQIEGVNNASGENEEFGNETGSSVNFTDLYGSEEQCHPHQCHPSERASDEPHELHRRRQDNNSPTLVYPSWRTRP